MDLRIFKTKQGRILMFVRYLSHSCHDMTKCFEDSCQQLGTGLITIILTSTELPWPKPVETV